jgi:hypothetical protein
VRHCNFCDKQFDQSVSYQIYCSVDCRDLATKEKIAARYLQSKRLKRKGKVRLCKSCSMPLSIYNDYPICNTCSVNPDIVAKAIKKIKDKSNDKNK